MRSSLIILTLVLCTPTIFKAEYSIEGRLNMKGDWQQNIYLATIDKLDDYHRTNSSHIVATAPILSDGTFVLSGNNLPSEKQYYRLYLIKEEHTEYNACLFEGGDEHNFIHLILDNSSTIIINANTTTYAPFGDYTITGDIENQLLKDVSDLVYPSYQFYEIKFPSELQFAQNKLNQDLFYFADTSKSTLASLAALLHTDFDEYILSKDSEYRDMLSKLEKEYSYHSYTEDYRRKMRYYGLLSSDSLFNYWKWFSFFLLGVIGFLGYHFISLRNTFSPHQPISPSQNITALTSQEQKILKLIKEGKSNKEIASELFVEVSTVKSHINKLYGKLKVSNRSEAKKIAENYRF